MREEVRTGEGERRVGSSDHMAVLVKLEYARPLDEPYSRRLWKWDAGDYEGLKQNLEVQDWSQILTQDLDNQVKYLTYILWQGQCEYIPFKDYKTRPGDLPWFGPRCKAAAEAKYRAWKRFKRRRTDRNRQLHTEAARNMKEAQKQAIESWKNDAKSKL